MVLAVPATGAVIVMVTIAAVTAPWTIVSDRFLPQNFGKKQTASDRLVYQLYSSRTCERLYYDEKRTVRAERSARRDVLVRILPNDGFRYFLKSLVTCPPTDLIHIPG